MILGSDLPKVPCSDSFPSFFMTYQMKFYQKDRSFMKNWNSFLAHEFKLLHKQNNKL